ncbi:5'/3'-nucleotidase SurE [Sporosarcina sp. G11-34]|uniref:5'/3'-nucleotidase SurE n=1 Tax=Sporosarcina sp. G11-34 TaxID=2849605 RepID=UPI0022A977F8|nr:5'/3'-nucleotidase SurE [Sporosarcina sp. G11-34]MCZ2259162.1 5'/3'-nucleotidase SurE [Sporosarcina sp. G11-34]
MKFLLTNDDGISSPGLAAIVEVMEQYGDVIVVCPNRDKSAVGHSVTFREALKVQETTVFGENVKAWTVNGTPADCVKMALEMLVPNEIDFVVSGMNIGSNIGRDSYYSGTIAGAREASFFGIPAVAVSLDVFDGSLTNFSESKKLFSNVMKTLLQKQYASNLLLNINIPYIEETQCTGIKFAELDYSIQRYKHVEMSDPSGRIVYWLKEHQAEHIADNPISDFKLLEEGYITVTPLEVQLTDQNYKREIEHWFKEGQTMQQESFLW